MRALTVGLVAALVIGCQSGDGDAAAGSPSPTALAGDELVQAVFTLISSDDFSCRAEQTAVLESDDQTVNVDGTFELEGRDGAGQITLRSQGRSFASDFVVHGEHAYVKLPGADWRRMPRELANTTGAQLDPFEFIDSADDLRYIGPSEELGEPLQLLTNSEPLPLDRGSSVAVQNRTGEVTDLELFVRGDGTPVLMRYHLEGTGESATGAEIQVSGDTETRFSDVGADFSIEPPEEFVD